MPMWSNTGCSFFNDGSRASGRETEMLPGAGRWLAALDLAHGFVDAAEIGHDLFAAALVYDLAPHDIAGVGHAVAGGRQPASDAVDAFAEDHFDGVDALAEHHDFQRLPRGGVADRDLLVVHITSKS